MSAPVWPEWSERFIKAGFPDSSLLAGTEPAVWAALGRLTLRDFSAGKQVVVRKALEDIGLGWVATNTTPFRIAIGGLFDAAENCHRRNAQADDNPLSEFPTGGKPLPAIRVHSQPLPESEASMVGPVTRTSATETNRKALSAALESCGACVIRKAIPASTVHTLPEAAQGKRTKLTRSMGNGIAGVPSSVYMSLNTPPLWYDALEQNLGRLLIGPGAPQTAAEPDAVLRRRSIVLSAGNGAENWAHQDNNNETPPLQAILMLSEPQTDFAGGEFYVARQTEKTDSRICIVRYTVAFETPGDLVIFKAGKNSGWWHGMLPVKAGHSHKHGQEYLRQAIGMLQPPG